MSSKNKLTIGFVLAFVFLCINSIISLYSIRQVITNNGLVSHTHAALSELQDVLSNVKDVETGQRGYAITGQKTFLEPYKAAYSRIEDGLQRLEHLIVEPNIRAQLPSLEQDIRKKIGTSRGIIQARNEKGLAEASRLIGTGTGKREMDVVRDEVAMMVSEETTLLQIRTNDAVASTRGALITLSLISIVSLIMLILLFAFIRRDSAQRDRIAADLKAIEAFSEDIVDTVREPLLMLDTSLRVNSANRAFYQTFKVTRAETENHLIYELGNGQWDIPALRILLEDIVPKNSVFSDFELEHSFPEIGRRVMLLNARQMKAGDHGELLVLAMEDVTERRRSEADLKAIEAYSQNIVDTVREPLLILDTNLRVRSGNRAFYQTFHVSMEETENQLIYELGNGQWDIPDLRRLLEDVVPKSSVFNDFELVHTFPSIGRRVMLLNARKLKAGNHGELLVLAMED
ncbi:MAG: CHASE3 domain-containing protein, partial [Chthonomonadales bacterium]